MDKGQRSKLLALVKAGHDVEEAAQMASVPMSAIDRAGPTLRRQIDDAYRLATSKLRSKLLEGVLGGDGDLRLLAGVLEHREATLPPSTADGGITKIEVAIVDSACPHCGLRPHINGGLADAPKPSPTVESEPAAQVKQPYTRRYGPSVRMGGI